MSPKAILSRVAIAAAVVQTVVAHPCDPEHETHCPTSGPDALGECIGKVAESDLSANCKDWIKLHAECSEELVDGKCAESAWSNDAEPCVKTWTQRADLSEKCKAFVPEPKVVVEELTEEQKKRKADRKRVRDQAAARARGEDDNKTNKKKNKGKKGKKAKKEEL